MSGAEGKSEVQLTRPGPGIIFPFGSATAPPHPHITQWCRFAVSERLPLQPFRQDRLVRLPLPPSVMASSSKTAPPAPSVMMPSTQDRGLAVDFDPFQKIQQLEKNLAFVQESHAYVLHSLHEEVGDLKQKNRELIFQLVTGFPSRPPQDVEKKEKDIPPEAKEKIEKLEKEVRKLRSALKEALKVNNSLTNQLQMIKREQYATSSSSRCYSRTPPDSSGGDGHRTRTPNGPSPQMEDYSDTLRQIQRATGHRSGKTPNGPSPQMEDYSDTLRQIQRATGHRSGKSSDSRHSDRMNGDWSGNYVENIRGYHHHHHHHQQHQQQHHQQQPRLPRLPLRNQQQNYSHHQYEIQYRQRNASTLPALKQPLIPVVEHRSDKPRKSRGSQRANKVLDHISNH